MKVKFSHALLVLHVLMLAMIVLPFIFYEDLFDRLAEELLSGDRSLEVFLATAFLLICRGIPILAELSVMVAGFHRYSFRKFLGIVTLGNLLLAFLYSVIGDQVADVTSVYVLAAVFLSIPMITYAARLLWLRRIEKV